MTLHVAELEQRLGTPLLLRGRRATPTAAGRVLVERGTALLAELDDLSAELQLHAKGRRGRVRIGASTGAIAHRLPQARALGAEAAGIDVQVSVTTSAEAMARIAAGTLDIGIVALPQPRLAGVTPRAWRRDPVVAVLPADWSAPQRITPAWLAARPLILNDPSTHLSRLCADWFARAGLRPQARVALNYNDAIRSLVAAGWGASLLPQEDEAAAGDARLQARPLSPALWRPLGLAWHPRADEARCAAVAGAAGRGHGDGLASTCRYLPAYHDSPHTHRRMDADKASRRWPTPRAGGCSTCCTTGTGRRWANSASTWTWRGNRSRSTWACSSRPTW